MQSFLKTLTTENEVHSKKKKRAYFKAAKGFRGGRRKLLRTVMEAVARCYAYRDRKNRKRDFRKLWILRINAAARQCDLNYSQLMYGLQKSKLQIDRKELAAIAYNDFETFIKIAEKAKTALAT